VAGSGDRPSPPPTGRPPAGYAAACATVLLVAVVLRVAGAFNDLWLDEIWSLDLVRTSVTSPLDVFTAVRHDNNHWLNSLVLYALGPGRPLSVYRLPAVGFGIATVVAGWAVGRRGGRAEGFVTLLLLGLSYLLVHYSSEARGYAPAVFFAVAGYGLMRRQLTAPSRAGGVLFPVCAALGVVSHLTFVPVYAGLLLWSVVGRPRGGWWADPAGRMIRLHALPLATLAGVYFADLRYQDVGGGPVCPLPAVLRQTAGWALGAPPAGGLDAVAGAVAVAAAGAGVWLARNRPDREWVFFAAVLTLPLLPPLLRLRPDFYPRYFLTSVPFVLILLARVLARAWRRGAAARAAVAVVLAAFCAGNLALAAEFFRAGRGQYRAAVAYIAARSGGGEVVVTGDHDFRNRTVFAFYAARDFPGMRWRYVPYGEWAASAPRWAVLHAFEGVSPVPEFTAPNGRRYAFRAMFPYAGASGWNWYIYEMEAG